MLPRETKLFILAAVLFLAPNSAFSEEGHDLTTIKGDQGIDLKAYDHAMAGSIKDFVVWGSVSEARATSELIMRRDGQDVKATFRRDGNKFGGIVQHKTSAGTKTTTIEFSGLDRQRNEYSFLVNGETVKAAIDAEDFRNNHFIKPTYKITTPNGVTTSFKFEGQACYNYSLHLLTLMLGALIH